jgi:hypothetical protein
VLKHHPNQGNGSSYWFFESLKAIKGQVTQMSTTCYSFNEIRNRMSKDDYDVSEIMDLLKRYKDLRNDTRDHFERINTMPCRATDQRQRCVIVVKLFLGLLTLDSYLFDLVSVLYPIVLLDEPSLRSLLAAMVTDNEHGPLLQHSAEQSQPVRHTSANPISTPSISSSSNPHRFDSALPHSLILERLDVLISSSTTSVKESIVLFKKFDPFGTRRMTFMLRIFCTEARKRGSIHKAWEEIEVWLDGLHREELLA